MAEENEPEKGNQGDEFKPITSQEELNKLIGARIAKVESRFADYEDIKAKAAKVDEAEEAAKTELQKAQERIAQLENDNAGLSRNALAAKIAAEEGVIPEVLHGTTEEEMRAAAARVKEWANQGRKPAPKPQSLSSGSGGEPKTGEKGRAAAALRSMRQG